MPVSGLQRPHDNAVGFAPTLSDTAFYELGIHAAHTNYSIVDITPADTRQRRSAMLVNARSNYMREMSTAKKLKS